MKINSPQANIFPAFLAYIMITGGDEDKRSLDNESEGGCLFVNAFIQHTFFGFKIFRMSASIVTMGEQKHHSPGVSDCRTGG